MAERDWLEVREACEAATPGPWFLDSGGIFCGVSHGTSYRDRGVFITDETTEANGTFIAVAREALPAALDEIERLRRDVKRWQLELAKQSHEVQQTLGKALNYPRFADDQESFPDATEADGVCVGEHIAETLATEAAREIERLRARVAALEAAIRPFAEYARWLDAGEYMGTPDVSPLLGPVICFDHEMTLGDCRRAGEALRQ